MSYFLRLRQIAVFVGVNAVVLLFVLELGLRLFPQLIPLDNLVRFQPTLKTEIAERRGLPRFAAMRKVPRDDGGSALNVFQPGALVASLEKDEGATTSVRMDSRGFCNPEHAAPEGRSDIVTIGDSFTYCTAVKPEETWTADLARRTGKSAYSFSRMGTGVHEYVQMLKIFGVSMAPRVVVMNVYEGNDVRDAQHYLDTRRGVNDQAAIVRVRNYWLLDHSYVAALIASAAGYKPLNEKKEGKRRNFLSELKKRYGRPNFTYELRFAGRTIPFNVDNADTDEAVYALAFSDQLIQSSLWESLREGLRAYVQLARKHGFRPIVSYTPSAYTAYAGKVGFHDPRLEKATVLYSQMQRDFFRQEASRIGYVFVDLTPALQAAAMTKGASALLYRPYNVHLSPEGHAVIAEALSAVVAPAR